MKAYVLYSGGLDSVLAIKLIQEQNISVIAVHFTSPFFGNPEFCQKIAKEQNFKLIIKKLGKKYFDIIRNPKYGYGSGFNPCLDCHLYLIKETQKIARGDIIATGEVLSQRPFSQKLKDFQVIEREAGLEGKILRPLSAKLLPETEYEKKEIIDRKKLLGIRGRSRRKQLAIAEEYNLRFSTPAGGCLLCEKEFAKKIKDLFLHRKRISDRDVELLKTGRHFRVGESKIIVGRNQKENGRILKLKGRKDFIFEVEGIGPTTLLLGKKSKQAIELAAELTLFYSDEKKASVKYGKKLEKKIRVKLLKKEELEKFKL